MKPKQQAILRERRQKLLKEPKDMTIHDLQQRIHYHQACASDVASMGADQVVIRMFRDLAKKYSDELEARAPGGILL